MLMLRKNGRRGITRGWRVARFVKRQTSRLSRRIAREAIRQHDGEIDRLATGGGYVW